MNALVVYESLFGNTHAIAEAIADGLRRHGEVRVVPVGEATADLVAWAGLVIAGGPTHAHGMSRSRSREDGLARAAKPDSTLVLDPAASGAGLREWLDALAKVGGTPAAAFDTRVAGPALLTGRASSAIANGLRKRGFRLATESESFLVDTHTDLVAGEIERATAWGEGIAALVADAGPSVADRA
ncbi:MAG TPA: flavodoxin domain-containing protein [Candidatus Limnocylindrales bacterium]|nr:flavodoxin domain-containing protein [Candidatus Limnocylindrales bacterium]